MSDLDDFRIEDVLDLSDEAADDWEAPITVPAAPPSLLPDPELSRMPDRAFSIPLWTPKWSKENLMRRCDEMTRQEFDRSYRQHPISAEDRLWQDADIERARDVSFCMPDTLVGSPWASARRFGGVDLAIAEERRDGSFFVISVIAIDANRHAWILRHDRYRNITFGEQFRIIRDVYRDLLWDDCGVESNAYQRAIIHHLEEDGLVPVNRVNTGPKEKIVGIPSMAAEWEKGRWHIPWGDARSRQSMEPLIEELRGYPSEEYSDDGIMSLFFAREVYRNVSIGVPTVTFIRG